MMPPSRLTDKQMIQRPGKLLQQPTPGRKSTLANCSTALSLRVLCEVTHKHSTVLNVMGLRQDVPEEGLMSLMPVPLL